MRAHTHTPATCFTYPYGFRQTSQVYFLSTPSPLVYIILMCHNFPSIAGDSSLPCTFALCPFMHHFVTQSSVTWQKSCLLPFPDLSPFLYFSSCRTFNIYFFFIFTSFLNLSSFLSGQGIILFGRDSFYFLYNNFFTSSEAAEGGNSKESEESTSR